MLALHFDNLLFFLFVAIALLFRWLASSATKTRSDSDEGDDQTSASGPPPVPRQYQTETTTDAERIRKFLEALGQPTTNQPPPPVKPRTDIPPRSVAPVRPPQTIVTFPRKQKTPPPVPKIRLPDEITTPPYQEKKFTAPVAQQVFEVQEREVLPAPPISATTPATAYVEVTRPPLKTVRREANIIELLRSPSGLRNAIILREVFGPPRSLQPLGGAGEIL